MFCLLHNFLYSSMSKKGESFIRTKLLQTPGFFSNLVVGVKFLLKDFFFQYSRDVNHWIEKFDAFEYSSPKCVGHHCWPHHNYLLDKVQYKQICLLIVSAIFNKATIFAVCSRILMILWGVENYTKENFCLFLNFSISLLQQYICICLLLAEHQLLSIELRYVGMLFPIHCISAR